MRCVYIICEVFFKIGKFVLCHRVILKTLYTDFSIPLVSVYIKSKTSKIDTISLE